MYVTLEPCAHQGRQPPCIEAILEAGIGRVVIASEDPSEKAAGRGPGDRSATAGVEVERRRGRRRGNRGAPPEPALPQALPHRHPARRPQAGDVARRRDDDPDRRLALDLRRARAASWSTAGAAEHDAIAVGIGTALADDPLLTARFAGARQPRRVVFDSAARLPLDAQLVRTLDQAPLTVVAGPDGAAGARSPRCARPGSRSSSPTASDPAERIGEGARRRSAAAGSPASSSRAAGPSPAPSRRPARSTSRVPSSHRCCSAPPTRTSSPTPRSTPAPRLVGAWRRRTEQVGADTLAHRPLPGVVSG